MGVLVSSVVQLTLVVLALTLDAIFVAGLPLSAPVCAVSSAPATSASRTVLRSTSSVLDLQ